MELAFNEIRTNTAMYDNKINQIVWNKNDKFTNTVYHFILCKNRAGPLSEKNKYRVHYKEINKELVG